MRPGDYFVMSVAVLTFSSVANSTCYVDEPLDCKPSMPISRTAPLTVDDESGWCSIDPTQASCSPRLPDLSWRPKTAYERRVLFESEYVQNTPKGCAQFATLLKTECNPPTPVIASFVKGFSRDQILIFASKRQPDMSLASDLDTAFKDYFSIQHIANAMPQVFPRDVVESIRKFANEMQPGSQMVISSMCKQWFSTHSYDNCGISVICTGNKYQSFAPGSGDRLTIAMQPEGVPRSACSAENRLTRIFAEIIRLQLSWSEAAPTAEAQAPSTFTAFSQMPLINQASGSVQGIFLDKYGLNWPRIAGLCSSTAAAMVDLALHYLQPFTDTKMYGYTEASAFKFFLPREARETTLVPENFNSTRLVPKSYGEYAVQVDKMARRFNLIADRSLSIDTSGNRFLSAGGFYIPGAGITTASVVYNRIVQAGLIDNLKSLFAVFSSSRPFGLRLALWSPDYRDSSTGFQVSSSPVSAQHAVAVHGKSGENMIVFDPWGRVYHIKFENKKMSDSTTIYEDYVCPDNYKVYLGGTICVNDYSLCPKVHPDCPTFSLIDQLIYECHSSCAPELKCQRNFYYKPCPDFLKIPSKVTYYPEWHADLLVFVSGNPGYIGTPGGVFGRTVGMVVGIEQTRTPIFEVQSPHTVLSRLYPSDTPKVVSVSHQRPANVCTPTTVGLLEVEGSKYSFNNPLPTIFGRPNYAYHPRPAKAPCRDLFLQSGGIEVPEKTDLGGWFSFTCESGVIKIVENKCSTFKLEENAPCTLFDENLNQRSGEGVVKRISYCEPPDVSDPTSSGCSVAYKPLEVCDARVCDTGYRKDYKNYSAIDAGYSCNRNLPISPTMLDPKGSLLARNQKRVCEKGSYYVSPGTLANSWNVIVPECETQGACVHVMKPGIKYGTSSFSYPLTNGNLKFTRFQCPATIREEHTIINRVGATAAPGSVCPPKSEHTYRFGLACDYKGVCQSMEEFPGAIQKGLLFPDSIGYISCPSSPPMSLVGNSSAPAGRACPAGSRFYSTFRETELEYLETRSFRGTDLSYFPLGVPCQGQGGQWFGLCVSNTPFSGSVPSGPFSLSKAFLQGYNDLPPYVSCPSSTVNMPQPWVGEIRNRTYFKWANWRKLGFVGEEYEGLFCPPESQPFKNVFNFYCGKWSDYVCLSKWKTQETNVPLEPFIEPGTEAMYRYRDAYHPVADGATYVDCGFVDSFDPLYMTWNSDLPQKYQECPKELKFGILSVKDPIPPGLVKIDERHLKICARQPATNYLKICYSPDRFPGSVQFAGGLFGTAGLAYNEPNRLMWTQNYPLSSYSTSASPVPEAQSYMNNLYFMCSDKDWDRFGQ